MKFRPLDVFASVSRRDAKYIENCPDGSRKSPTMHKYVDGKSATHGPDPRIAQHLVATKSDNGWDLKLIKEDVQIVDNLAGSELVGRRITETRDMGKAANDAQLGKMFRAFVKAAKKVGYEPEPKMALDIVALAEMPAAPKPSAQIIRPACWQR